MAEIKFTTERMVEVKNRIDDMIAQLNTSTSAATEKISSIAGNIQSDNTKTVLASYSETVTEKCSETIKFLQELNAYLENQIGAYSATDQAGIESMTEVQNILSQLSL